MKQNSSIQESCRSSRSFRFSPFGELSRPNRFAVLVGAAMLLLHSVAKGSILYYWDGSQPAPNSGSDPNIAMGVFSTGNSGPTMIYTGSSKPSDYTGASAGDNFQARDPGGDPSVTSASTYFSITLTPSAGYVVTLGSISLGSRSTTSGPTTIAVYSSIDNYATALGTGSSSGSWSFQAIDFSGDSLTSVDGEDATLRIYGYGGGGSSSSYNWHIDDINFAVSLAAVPEPPWLGLMAGAGLLGVCVLHMWRQRRRLYSATSI